MDRLQTMKTFVRVVDEGGFAAAARALEVDQALVTRQVANLERHLGVKLLERTTRSMRLTEAGDTFLARCRDILSDVAEAEAMVSRSHQDMVGRVRLALPTVFGMEVTAQQLTRLHEEFPDITVEMAMLDRAVDPVAEGFDVVIADTAGRLQNNAIPCRLPRSSCQLIVALRNGPRVRPIMRTSGGRWSRTTAPGRAWMCGWHCAPTPMR